MNPENLHLARHYLRREHERAARNNEDDLDLIATAYEELCSLQGRLDTLTVLCQFFQDQPCHAPDMSFVHVIGAAIGLSDISVLNFKASFSGRVEPQDSADSSTVSKCC
ncbi:MAG: hypothetical protein ACE5GU_09040 [Candidatus Scalinduaceae bacterium]